VDARHRRDHGLALDALDGGEERARHETGASRRIVGTPAVTTGDSSFWRASHVNVRPAAISDANGRSFAQRKGTNVA